MDEEQFRRELVESLSRLCDAEIEKKDDQIEKLPDHIRVRIMAVVAQQENIITELKRSVELAAALPEEADRLPQWGALLREFLDAISGYLRKTEDLLKTLDGVVKIISEKKGEFPRVDQMDVLVDLMKFAGIRLNQIMCLFPKSDLHPERLSPSMAGFGVFSDPIGIRQDASIESSDYKESVEVRLKWVLAERGLEYLCDS